MKLTPVRSSLSDGSNNEGRAPRFPSSSIAPSPTSAVAALFLLTSLGCADPGSVDSVSSPVIQGDPVAAGEYRSTVLVTTRADFYNPTTGALVFRQEPASCTGTIIGEQEILTAAHCTLVHGERVEFAPGQVLEVRRPINMYITREGTNGIVSVSNFVDHPTLDVAVGYLISEVPRPYAVIAERFDQVPPQAALVTMVGYGLDENGASGRKLKGTATLSIRAEGSPIGLTPGPTGQTTCDGDSGGPVFDDARSGGSGVQFGLLNSGDAGCALVSFYQPTHSVFGWIQDLAPNVNEPEDNGNGNPPDKFFGCAESAGGGATGFGMILLGGLARRRRRNANGHQPSAAPLS